MSRNASFTEAAMFKGFPGSYGDAEEALFDKLEVPAHCCVHAPTLAVALVEAKKKLVNAQHPLERAFDLDLAAGGQDFQKRVGHLAESQSPSGVELPRIVLRHLDLAKVAVQYGKMVKGVLVVQGSVGAWA